MGVAVFQFPSFQSRSVPMLEEVGQKTTRKKKTGILYRFQFRAISYRTRRMSNMPWMRETPLPDFSSEALGQPPWWDWSGNGSAPPCEGVFGVHHRSAGSVSSVHCFLISFS